MLEAINDLPIRQVNGAMVYIRDVAHVHDGLRGAAEHRARRTASAPR